MDSRRSPGSGTMRAADVDRSRAVPARGSPYHGIMRRPQLIPPPDSAPPSIGHLSPADRVLLWARMVDEGDRLLYEGFLRQHRDPDAARRAMIEWLERRDAEATAAKIRMLSASAAVRQPDGG